MTTKRTDELQPGDVVRVAGRLCTVRSRIITADDDGAWDLDLDPHPVEIPPGPLRHRPSGETWTIHDSVTEDDYRTKAQSVRLGDFVVQFNPLTGDLMVTSGTETIVVEPVKPGKIRLTSKRHDPNVGVKI